MRQTSLPRNLILVFAIVLTPVLFIAQSSDPMLRSLERQYALSNIQIEISEAIATFKNQLLEKDILKQTDLVDPSKLYQKLDAALPTILPLDLNIPAYISKAPLASFLRNQDVLNASISNQSAIALFTYYQLISEKHTEFELYLMDSRLVQFKEEDLPINSFEAVLFEEFAARQDKNVSLQNAKMIIKADPNTPIEFVNLIKDKLAAMGLRRLEFRR